MADNKADNYEFQTAICREQASDENPFVACKRWIAGYDSRSLWQKCSFTDLLVLQLTGDLPNANHRHILEMLLCGLASSGPRDTACRTAMLAGISKTRPEHLLPIGLLASEGERNGTNAVEAAHRFLRKYRRADPAKLVFDLAEKRTDALDPVVPGFGHSYGAIDPLTKTLAADILHATEAPSATLLWASKLADALAEYDQGWLLSGLTAAVCIELGISARASMGVFQLGKAPAVLGYAMEQSKIPINDRNVLSDEHYERIDEP